MVKQFAFQANNMSSSLITRNFTNLFMITKKKKFIKNKNLIWLNLRKNSRINLNVKIQKYFDPLIKQQAPVEILDKNQQPVLKKEPTFKYYYFLLQYLLKRGKKYTLEVLFKKSMLNWMQHNSSKKFVEILNLAYKNLIPHVGVITKRKGSKNIYIPYRLSQKKQTKWVLLNALAKKKRKFYDGILEELLECSTKTSVSIKKKKELLKLAEENVHNLKKRR
jgi:ribosomal protein S7